MPTHQSELITNFSCQRVVRVFDQWQTLTNICHLNNISNACQIFAQFNYIEQLAMGIITSACVIL